MAAVFGGARNAGQVGDKNTPAMKEAGRESDSGAEEGYLAVKRSSSARDTADGS